MKNKYTLTFVALLLLAGTATEALAEPGARGRSKFQPFLTRDRTTVSLSGGLRQSDMRWNIAGDTQGANPNILSELEWDGVQTVEGEAKVRHIEPASRGIFKGALQLEGSVRGGFGLSGDVVDSDYAGDNRTLMFSRATADASSGYTIGAQAAVGYRFNVAQSVSKTGYTFITLAPLVGYGWDHERFKMEGVQVNPPPVGTPAKLDSDYNAHWYGPFIGLEAEWEHNRHMLSLRGELHDLTYYADADWNLRTDFAHDPSFEHEGDGTGKKISLQYSYAPEGNYEFVIDVSHAEREMTNGTDTTYFANGTQGRTRVNEVEHTSQTLRLGMNYGW